MSSNSAKRQLAGDASRLRDAGWAVLHDAMPADLIHTLAEAEQTHGRPPPATASGPEAVLQLEPHWVSTTGPPSLR